MKLLFVSFIFFLSFFPHGASQSLSLLNNSKQSTYEIPFEYHNHFIIVTVIFEQLFPLKFIFDTGAEHTIITKKNVVEILDIPYVRDFKIIGSDLKQELVAHLIQNIRLETGNISAGNQSLLVLQDDYFRFEDFAGVNIHGILGASFFRGFVVKINFDRKSITLQKVEKFKKPDSKFIEMPLQVFKNKPYLDGSIQFNQSHEKVPVKLLLDTGAGLSLLLHSNTKKGLELPENVIRGNIGEGLGGFLYGMLGRAHLFELGEIQFNDVLVNFQELTENMDTTHMNGRNGIIGNQILNRFQIIIDYPNVRLFLRPQKKLKEKFEFDRSGLIVIAGGSNFNQFTVHDVVKGSPADEAGIQTKDVIEKVNGVPAWMMSLQGVTKKLRKKPGKVIKLEIRRGNEVFKTQFTLRDLI